MATKPITRDDATGVSCFIRHNYHDHATETLYSRLMYRASKIILTDKSITTNNKNQEDGAKTKGAGGSLLIPFPVKLHLVLSIAENDSFDDIVSW